MKKKLIYYVIFPILLLLVSFFVYHVYASPITYIYFDLNCGDVIINASTYSGCVYKTVDGVTSEVSVSDNHSAANYYYVYQSNDTNFNQTGYVDDQFILPVYNSIYSTIETDIINNTDVDEVINVWKTAAGNAKRNETLHRIAITGNSTFDIVIDNLWSSHHTKSTGRSDGGLSFKPSSSGKTIVRLKGDNRFGNIYYYNSSDNASLTFTSFDGDGSNTGSLTIANLVEGASNNYWNSAIGASDSGDSAYNIIFNGGTTYAGTTTADNCTAIGGGGNGTGKVEINGGIITAVSNSTGTAIGGGIGMSSAGGNAVVEINGGIVYAYNTGQAYAANVFVPGVAIGGGSSRYSNGNTSTTVSITGGVVYAEARGGVAIGGGSSATKNGGAATVNIDNDAIVTAKSIEGKYTYSGKEYTVKAGSGIGGGTGGTSGNGGNANVTISGGTITSGTIGGGEMNNTTGVVGSATINIQGGIINGRILMNIGTFNMSGGTLTGGFSENGGCVQMNGGDATITGGEITKCNASSNGGAIYLNGGTFTTTGGEIYDNTATEDGGAVYLGGGTFNLNGGNIYENIAQNGGAVYVADGTVNVSLGKLRNNVANTGHGGGVYIGGGNYKMTGGEITNNKATINGGGVYQDSGIYTMSDGIFNNNTAKNGGGAYVNSATFSLTGGKFDNNEASLNGGGFYIGDNSLVTLSDGEIVNNSATNGGGFYQTENDNETITSLSRNCLIDSNKAINGNGGGVYIDGGSIFRMVGGKVIYNQATADTMPNVGTLAKDSLLGVGGGVYISKGTFTMYDENNKAGNAAIFGNEADYAADDLFASGNSTSFDAISVANMSKADAYKTADSWFEDYPYGESHITLNYEHRNDTDTSNEVIVSTGRYKDIENVDDMNIASTVLYRNCKDYIAITMGNSVGKIRISVNDDKVIKEHAFIYKIESCSTENCNDEKPEVELEVTVQKGQDAIIVALPTGMYKISLVSGWSWRYDNEVEFDIIENAIKKETLKGEFVKVNVYTDQYTEVNTLYNLINKKWLSKTDMTVWSNPLIGVEVNG